MKRSCMWCDHFWALCLTYRKLEVHAPHHSGNTESQKFYSAGNAVEVWRITFSGKTDKQELNREVSREVPFLSF